VLLCAAVYGGFLLLTFHHDRLSPPLFAALAAPLLALQASMQHEFIHGHPTPWRRLNRALGAVPLSLWLPFESYRRSHLVHHCDEALTDPLDDPESYYWSPDGWARLGPLGRGFVRFHTTLAGRLLFGPAWNIGRYLLGQARALRAGDGATRRIWAWHAFMVTAILVWVVGVCRIDPLFYAFAVVYPSTSILLLRSFAEHRAAQGVFERTAIVENAPILGFLFLYNNLHAAHHERPSMPWYELPRWYRLNRERLVDQNRDLLYDGYAEVARRFLLVAHDVSVHPDHAALAGQGTPQSRTIRAEAPRRTSRPRLAGLTLPKFLRSRAKTSGTAVRSVP